MTEPSKLFSENEEARRVAKALGVDLGEEYTKEKKEKESSSKKTDTLPAEKVSRSGDEGKDPDYKKMYADSTKEFQEVWKPTKDKLEKIEKISGKSIDDIVKEYENTEGDSNDKNKKDTPKKGEEGKKKNISSVEERLGVVEGKQKIKDEQDSINAKGIIDAFCEDNDVSESEYSVRYAPLLDGIKEMRKPNGDPYDLEEGLNIAYIIANKDNIDKVVEEKVRIMKKEKDTAGFSPSGKESSGISEKGKFSEEQQEIAKKMGTDLLKEE